MSVTMREMLEAGVHFGHQTRYWNPKMAPYIFGHRNKIHIINLEKTLAMYQDALKFVRQLTANKGSILFVGTKRQAREIVKEEAQRCRRAVRRLPLAGRHAHQLQDRQGVDQAPEGHGAMVAGRHDRAPAEEGSARTASARCEKLERWLGGIKDMNGLPDALFVIDVGYHKIAVAEANKLGIPVDRRGRHQPLARRRRLRDPGQRRLEPRHPPLRARRGRRDPRGPQPGRQGDRGAGDATSSSKSRKPRSSK